MTTLHTSPFSRPSDPKGGGTLEPMSPQDPPALTPPFGFVPRAVTREGLAESPVTPFLLRARYVEPLVINRGAASQKYEVVQVDRPVIIWPITVVQAPLLYAPVQSPVDFLGLGTVAGQDSGAMRSFGPGICYFSQPGRWWLRYSAATGICSYLVIDASDPGTLARYLIEDGTNGTQLGSADGSDATANRLVTNPAAGAYLQVVAENRFRQAITLQCIGGTACRIMWGDFTTAPGGVPMATAQGYLRLAVNGTMTLTGRTLTRSAIYSVADSGAATTVSFVEYAG